MPWELPLYLFISQDRRTECLAGVTEYTCRCVRTVFSKLQLSVVCAVTHSPNRLQVILKHGLPNNRPWGPRGRVAPSAWQVAGNMQSPGNTTVRHAVFEPAAEGGPVPLSRDQTRVTWGSREAHRSAVGPDVYVSDTLPE